nr:MAG TPA: hypothetical protein [Caudoviricetes sp.]
MIDSAVRVVPEISLFFSVKGLVPLTLMARILSFASAPVATSLILSKVTAASETTTGFLNATPLPLTVISLLKVTGSSIAAVPAGINSVPPTGTFAIASETVS